MSLLSLVGISDAVAAATQAAGTAASSASGAASSQGSILSMLPMLAAIVFVFYFLLIRPQKKRQKEHNRLISEITKGDEVVTNAGLLGKIVRMTDDFVILNVSEGVDVTVQKSAIANALPKGTISSV